MKKMTEASDRRAGKLGSEVFKFYKDFTNVGEQILHTSCMLTVGMFGFPVKKLWLWVFTQK